MPYQVCCIVAFRNPYRFGYRLGCTFDAAENDFSTGICFLVGLNKLNCILGVNPLYYSYGIADYFLSLLANFELYFNKESNILETIIVIFD